MPSSLGLESEAKCTPAPALAGLGPPGAQATPVLWAGSRAQCRPCTRQGWLLPCWAGRPCMLAQVRMCMRLLEGPRLLSPVRKRCRVAAPSCSVVPPACPSLGHPIPYPDPDPSVVTCTWAWVLLPHMAGTSCCPSLDRGLRPVEGAGSPSFCIPATHQAPPTPLPSPKARQVSGSWNPNHWTTPQSDRQGAPPPGAWSSPGRLHHQAQAIPNPGCRRTALHTGRGPCQPEGRHCTTPSMVGA